MSDIWAITILATYFVVAVIMVLYQACRCPAGWNVWWIYALERFYVPFMFRWRSNRRCPFPDEGSALIIANHRSPVDPLLIWMQHHLSGPSARIRRISFLTAREYCELPGLIGWMCQNLHSIPVNRDGRDMASVREALRRLRNGELVAVFPEGGINKGSGLRPANPGVAWLALHSKVTVYPIFIRGAPQAESMIQPFHTLSRVNVVYGEPIDLTPYYDRKTSPELLQEVTDLMMRRLGELEHRRGDDHR